MHYSKKVMNRFLKPKYAGKIKNPDAVGRAGNPMCGDLMEVYLKVDKGVIKKIKFNTFGCGMAIAASDALCELAEGKTVDEAEKITSKDIMKLLGGKIPPIKVHCSILGMETLKNAIKNYKENKDPNGRIILLISFLSASIDILGLPNFLEIHDVIKDFKLCCSGKVK